MSNMTTFEFTLEKALDLAELWLQDRDSSGWYPENIQAYLDTLPETVTEMDEELRAKIMDYYEEWVEDGGRDDTIDPESDENWNEGSDADDPDLLPEPEDAPKNPNELADE